MLKDEQTCYRAEQSPEKSVAQRRAELMPRIQVDRVSMLKMSGRATEESRAQASDRSSPRLDAQDEQTRYRAEQSSEESGA